MHSPSPQTQTGDDNGDGSSTFTCVMECTSVCQKHSLYCLPDRFYKYKKDKACDVKVRPEAEEAKAQADSNDGGYETFVDMSSMDNILNMNGDPDMYEDILEDALDDPDASVNTILNAFGLGNSSTRVITSGGISLFTAASASIAFLLW